MLVLFRIRSRRPWRLRKSIWIRGLSCLRFRSYNKTKTYTRSVKSGLKKKLDVGVSSGDRKFKSASEEIKYGFTNISSGEVRVSQRKGKEVLEEQPQPKRSKKQIREEEASLAEIARIQAQEAAEI
ncbi:hypothetical protein Tco_0033128 [Tanacetum coccineum]